MTHPIGAPPVRSSLGGAPRPGLSTHSATGGNVSSGCYGVWPSGWGGQSTYEGDCYGHDEPGLDPYSSLPGSGGNVTWSVTLPTDGSGSTTQSQLYSAIWFGLVLSAPGAWLNECFLELQFYPDNPTTNTWAVESFAWQIDLLNGYEDPCFYYPLFEDGTSDTQYLELTGGDHLNVTLTGWAGDAAGEEIQIHDLTQGNVSTQYLVDQNNGAPLDPAYSTDSYPNALQWTPGGELPVSFAFETGHTSGPYPNNNSYGGCSSGVPPPTGQDPATPCPSYDPGLWSNGTDSPWAIASPTFFNANTRVGASQVEFTQDFGGIAWTDALSNGSCTGRDGSAFCSYPWYSYNCASHAFNFGATPYPGAADQFGATQEYTPMSSTDLEQFGFFAPRSDSVPACGSPSYTVGVSASGGAAEFLHVNTTALHNFTGLGPGEYSLVAYAPGGSRFDRWTVTGSVSVSDAFDAWSSLLVSGNGTVAATFSSSAPETTVVVHLVGDPSYLGPALSLEAGLIGTGGPATPIAVSGSIALPAGIYTIQGYPPTGYNFSAWSWNGSIGVAASTLPFTWLTVSTGGGRVGNLTIEVVASSVRTSVLLEFGGTSGSARFDGITYSSSTTLTVGVGSHGLTALPAAGSRWLSTELYTSSAMQLDLNQSTVIVLPEGVATTTINVTFGQDVSVTLATTGGSGEIQWATTAEPNGTVVQPPEPSAGTQYWPIEALPGVGERFTGWSVSSSFALGVANSSAVATVVALNSSGTLVAHFASSPATTVHFVLDGPGAIEFNGGPWVVTNSTNASVAIGSYGIEFLANSTFQVHSEGVTGNLTLAPRLVSPPIFEYILFVQPGGGTVTLGVNSTLPPVRPVTFVSSPWSDFALDLNGTEYTTGSTALLLPGTYSIGPVVLGGCAFAEWVTTVNLTADVLASGGVGTLTVSGSGSIYALPVPSCQPLKARAGPSVQFGDAPLSVAFTSTASGGVPPYTEGWQFGDGTGSNATNTTHQYTANGTYTARLTIYDQVGEGYTASWPITVNARPSVSLGIAPANATAPAVVRLTATVLGGTAPFQFHWVFGDGTSANGAGALTRQYSAAGNYTVNVTVTDQVGISDSASGLLVLHAPKIPPPPLTGSLALNASSVHVGQAVQLLAAASGGTPSYRYVWSGLPSGCPNGPGPGELNCTPAAKGNYSVVAEILDSGTQSYNASAPLQVLPAVAHNTSVPPPQSPPTASPWPLLLALAVAAAAAAAFVSFLLLRRRRGQAPGSGTSPPEPPG